MPRGRHAGQSFEAILMLKVDTADAPSSPRSIKVSKNGSMTVGDNLAPQGQLLHDAFGEVGHYMPGPHLRMIPWDILISSRMPRCFS
jgi:hypothetical protein